MIVKIQRDEIVDLFKEMTLREIDTGSTPGCAINDSLKALESFFKTNIVIQFEYPE